MGLGSDVVPKGRLDASPIVLTGEPLTAFLLTVPQMDGITPALVAVPSLAYGTLPIEPGRGHSGTHSFHSLVLALGSFGARVLSCASFHVDAVCIGAELVPSLVPSESNHVPMDGDKRKPGSSPS